jgi:hypothetical protein
MPPQRNAGFLGSTDLTCCVVSNSRGSLPDLRFHRSSGSEGNARHDWPARLDDAESLLVAGSQLNLPWRKAKRVPKEPLPSLNRVPIVVGKSAACRAACLPISRKIVMLQGSSDSPLWKRGKISLSSTRASLPACARNVAVLLPHGPQPIAMASQVVEFTDPCYDWSAGKHKFSDARLRGTNKSIVLQLSYWVYKYSTNGTTGLGNFIIKVQAIHFRAQAVTLALG